MTLPSTKRTAILALVALSTLAPSADAGWRRRATRAARPTACQETTAAPAPTYQAPAVAYQPTGGDLLSAINACRARYRLHPLAYDTALSSWAAANTSAQHAHGLGHFVMHRSAAQISAGTSDPGYAVRLWEVSAAHRVYLLSPRATVVGVSNFGSFATANIR